MKVLITGGNGFLGRRLAEQIVAEGGLRNSAGGIDSVDALQLFDVADLELTPELQSAGAQSAVGDIGDAATVNALVDRPDMAIFHLASVVSGQGEKDFDLAMRVNITGQLNLLAAARALGSAPRYLFASSMAVFGGDAMDAVVGDNSKQTATTTYGVSKTVGELLVNDYSRKGFLDGRSARLPTVIVRPGKPNGAASSFVSGLFREPLAGVAMNVPVAPSQSMPVAGYRSIVENFLRLIAVPAEQLGSDRAVGLPAINAPVSEMVAAVRRVAAEDGLALAEIGEERDPFIERIVGGWATAADNSRAFALGLTVEETIDQVVRAYWRDYGSHLVG